jgi:hypothetical protein
MTSGKQLAIGCLGWGSLVWDPRDLPLRSAWFEDGPSLPIEFARQSANGRITLVICGIEHRVPTCWSLLKVVDLTSAKAAFAVREGIKKRHIQQHVGFCEAASGRTHGAEAETIAHWARGKNLDAVLWANLPIGFIGRRGRIPPAEEILDYLRRLPPVPRILAEEYIRRTPPQVETRYRRRIEQELGWVRAS